MNKKDRSFLEKKYDNIEIMIQDLYEKARGTGQEAELAKNVINELQRIFYIQMSNTLTGKSEEVRPSFIQNGICGKVGFKECKLGYKCNVCPYNNPDKSKIIVEFT